MALRIGYRECLKVSLRGVGWMIADDSAGNDAVQGALRPMFSRFDYFLCKCFFDIR